MKNIVFRAVVEDVISFDDVKEDTPIFVRDNHSELIGMVVEEAGGWIVRLGGANGADGWHNTRLGCMKSCEQYGYSYFVEEQR